MTEYILTRVAQADLEEVVAKISREDPRTAQRFAQEAKAAFTLLAEQPGLGHARPDLTDRPVLFWPIMKRSFAVIYRRSTPLVIVRVVRWRRDITALPLDA